MPASEENPIRFTPRGLLIPERLLEQTNAGDNPLIVYSDRATAARSALVRLMEIVLLALGALIALHAFVSVKNLNLVLQHPGDSQQRVIYLLPDCVPFLYLGFIFLLLRYLLLVSNCLRHISFLSRNRTPELILTELGRDEYFLHPLLNLSRVRRILIACGAIWLGAIALDIRLRDSAWLSPPAYFYPVMTVHLILLTWIAAIFQYSLEWDWFAGGRQRFRILKSLALSLALSACIWIFFDIEHIYRSMLSADYKYIVKYKHLTGRSWITGLFAYLVPVCISLVFGYFIATVTANTVYQKSLVRLRNRVQSGQ